ncbi:MAG: Asp-tRNA(Asn)/Glu-tRNA(Gln) amidotransferase GatCAB subunit A [Gammaproteobacteria bacterium]|nr:Asp-tRNA(Asn)/Glu-tRNA(Gln) amidotransferase GatCAB subunit A [Gammaproteobacteria bacterium]
MINSIHYSSISEVAYFLKKKEISPVELTEYMLNRIESVDANLKSYVTITADHAMKAAAKAESEIIAGHYRGPLHGIPLALKDLCYTKGIPTMGGLKVRRDFTPSFDATVVEKLRNSGCIFLGKLNLTEGALSGYNPEFDIPNNPWRSDLWAGVSSSGSGAATAAGLCFGSIGTDTGGSIRYPSMANGIVGLKPTYGSVSRYGVMELARTLDHVGPMTRTVKDTAIIFEAIAGHDERDVTSLDVPAPQIVNLLSGDIDGLTLGVDQNYLKRGTDPGLISGLEKAIVCFNELGAKIVEVSMPPTDPMEMRNLWLPICGYEAARAHSETFPSREREYGGYLKGVLELGLSLSEVEYQEAVIHREEYAKLYRKELTKADALICPAGGFVFPVDKKAQYGDATEMAEIIKHFQGQFTIPADLAGIPGITLPCGFSEDNRPYAMQLLGDKHSEVNLCKLAYAYEQANEWHLKHPPL